MLQDLEGKWKTNSHCDTKREVVMELIKNNRALGFTTDIWISQQMEAYMTVTAHFIQDNW